MRRITSLSSVGRAPDCSCKNKRLSRHQGVPSSSLGAGTKLFHLDLFQFVPRSIERSNAFPNSISSLNGRLVKKRVGQYNNHLDQTIARNFAILLHFHQGQHQKNRRIIMSELFTELVGVHVTDQTLQISMTT